MEAFFDRRGGWLIVFGRFVEGVRQFLSIVVGMSEMSFRRFLFFTTIGAALWCATWSGLGYFAGDHVETVSRYITYVAIGHRRAHRRHRASSTCGDRRRRKSL